MANQYTGTQEITLAGKTCQIVYDWLALSEIHTEYGKEIINNLFKAASPEQMAGILAIGLKKHHADMTKEAILELSPPFIPTVAVIDKALAFAYFGPGIEHETESEAAGEAEPTKKKTK